MIGNVSAILGVIEAGCAVASSANSRNATHPAAGPES
jgi:hypothetical protein